MMIAGEVDLLETLRSLARRRPVFQSERDFQLALAWEVQLAAREMHVYLESRPKEGVHLDLEFVSRDETCSTAIELKYFTRKWSGVVKGQQYSLKNQSAHDNGRYGVVRDIHRVEEFVRLRPNSNGAVIALTNDPHYWTPSTDTAAIDAAFRVGEGTVLEGKREWSRIPTRHAKSQVLNLSGRHELRWTDFSAPDNETPLRMLVIELPGSATSATA